MRGEIENPMVLPTHQPDVPITYRTCTCGCRTDIALGYDDHIVIDDEVFATEECVSEFFIHECGGQKVYAL